ncbi:MAG: hypothetical protein GC131_08580 [Alphaproteobacteria bacterium]|nr:hypothetical protein [Alphaproteobacteria bacterium]
MRKDRSCLTFAVLALAFMPAAAHANSADFSGAVAIGTGYAGAVAAPTDGLIVEGDVGIGTSTVSHTLELNGTFNAAGATTLGSTLDVTGAATLSSTLGVTGATTLSDTLAVTGATTLGDTLGITGAVTLSDLNAAGVVTTDASGVLATNATLPAGQFPALTGDVTTAGGVLATTVAAIQGETVSGTTGTTSVVFSGSPTIATPTITTSATVPLVIGGTGAASTLTLESTSGTGTSDAIIFNTGSQVEAMRITTDGAIGIGTAAPLAGAALDVNGVANITSLKLNQNPAPHAPGGRLTLSSNTPVMIADVNAATTIYYAAFVGDLVPIYDGTNWSEYALGGQISLALDSDSGHTGYQQSGKLFDLVIRNNSGSAQLCTGPAWSSDTARASAIVMQNGIWTNSGSWTAKCDTTSSTYTCSANQCTYVGTMYATANGQTQMNMFPGQAAGGTNNIVGLYNAYNRVRLVSVERDSTANYSYTTGAWRACNNSTSNRITFVDGLGQSIIVAPMQGNLTVGTSGFAMQSALDATSPNGSGYQPATNFTPSSGTVLFSGATTAYYVPVLGLHFVQCIEYGGINDTFRPPFRYMLAIEMDN